MYDVGNIECDFMACLDAIIRLGTKYSLHSRGKVLMVIWVISFSNQSRFKKKTLYFYVSLKVHVCFLFSENFFKSLLFVL